MNIYDKIDRLYQSLRRAKKSGNFRRIHKWENALEHAHRRRCPWNPLVKRKSLVKIKTYLDGLDLVNQYKWEWCGSCKCAFIQCPQCGNNCCGGSYGQIQTGVNTFIKCPVCKTAYAIQEFAYRLGKEPKRSSFPNADETERKADDAWDNSFKWLDGDDSQLSNNK